MRREDCILFSAIRPIEYGKITNKKKRIMSLVNHSACPVGSAGIVDSVIEI